MNLRKIIGLIMALLMAILPCATVFAQSLSERERALGYLLDVQAGEEVTVLNAQKAAADDDLLLQEEEDAALEEQEEDEPLDDEEGEEEASDELEEEEIEPYEGETGALLASNHLMGEYEYEQDDPFALLVDEYVLVAPEVEWDTPVAKGVMETAAQEIYELVHGPDEETVSDNLMEAAMQELYDLVQGTDAEESESNSVMEAAMQELLGLVGVEEFAGEATSEERGEEFQEVSSPEMRAEPSYEVKATDRYIVKYKDNDNVEAHEELERVAAELLTISLPELDEVVAGENNAADEATSEETAEGDTETEKEKEQSDESDVTAQDEDTEEVPQPVRGHNTVQISGEQLELMILEEPIAPSELREILEELDIVDSIEYVQPDYELSLEAVEMVLEEIRADDRENQDAEPESDPAPEPEPEPEEDNEPEDDAHQKDGEESFAPDEQEHTENKESNGNTEEEGSSVVNNDSDDDEEDAEEDEKGDEKDVDDEQKTVRESGPVVVAVIDTGIDVTHPALEGYLWADEETGALRGWNVVDDNDVLFDEDYPMASAHGTHIAGAIADTARKHGADVVILPVKVFENGVAYTSDVIAGIEYAKSMGASVINMSFGSRQDNPALAEALLQTDALMVTAVGNSRRDLEETPSYPSGYRFDNVLSVASVNADDGFSYYSNYGPEMVDLAARGREVVAALPGGNQGLMSGTSMSAAQASAASAVTLAVSGVEMTVPELRERMIETADRMRHLENKVGEGRRLNLQSAIDGERSDEALDVQSEDDFDVHGYQPDEGELFELFSESRVVQVAAGDYHSLALMDDGTVWAWGNNTYGQIGNNRNYIVSTYSQVIGLQNVVQIGAAANTSFALLEDGTVWRWGYDYYGLDNWIPIQFRSYTNIIDLHIGDPYSMVIDEDHVSYRWETAKTTQLVIQTDTDRYQNAKQIVANGLQGLVLYNDGSLLQWWEDKSSESTYINCSDVCDVAVGKDFCLALQTDGTVLAWGFDNGILGKEQATRRDIDNPTPIDEIKDVREVYAAYDQAVAVLSDGTIVRWGNTPTLAEPTIVPLVNNLRSATIGRNQIVFLDDGGKLWGRGDNAFGQINPEYLLYTTPQLIDKTGPRAPISGYDATYLIQEDGALVAWGQNDCGQLGDGTYVNSDTPVLVTGLDNVKEVIAGQKQAIAICADDSIWAWGQTKQGALNTPQLIEGLNGIVKIRLSTDLGMAVALTDEGMLWKIDMEMGDYTIQRMYQFDWVDDIAISQLGVYMYADGIVYLVNDDGVEAILFADDLVSMDTICVEDFIGYIVCLSDNDDLASYMHTFYALIHITDEPLQMYVVGRDHAMYLDDNGDVYAWGGYHYGQMGDIHDIYEAQFVVSGARSISAGWQTSFAVMEDGSIYGWGNNRFGAISSDAPALYYDTPVTIPYTEQEVELEDYSVLYYLENEDEPFDTVQKSGEVGSTIPTEHDLIYDGELPIGYSNIGVVRDGSATVISEDPEENIVHVELLENSYTYTLNYYYEGEDEPFDTLLRSGKYGQEIPDSDDLTYSSEMQEGYNPKGVAREDSATQIGEDEEANIVHIVLSEQRESSLGEAELALDVRVDERYLVSLKASGVDTFAGRTLTVEYDPEVLQLVDLAAQSSGDVSVTAGSVDGTDLTIQSHENGVIVFVSTKEIPDDREWTGLITLLEFQALASAETVVALA